MLAAMFSAKVGDDVFEEDETVNALEEKVASMFGMEAGIFCPSGTMTNQIAIKCFTNPLDEVIADKLSHVYQYEGGGIAFNSLASVRLLDGDRGKITAEMIEANINPTNIHHPVSSLVVLENTVNKGGGSYYRVEDIEPIYHLCRLKQLKLHLDGARLFNALIETRDDPKEYGRIFDGISICLSKGLGAPVGSVFIGSSETIKKARRIRKVLGGAMRQAGYLAAAGIYALDNHVERLQEDNRHAKALGEVLKSKSFVRQVLPVDTNIVIFELEAHYRCERFIDSLAHAGIKCTSFGPQMIRMVTHLDITPTMIEYTLQHLNKLQH